MKKCILLVALICLFSFHSFAQTWLWGEAGECKNSTTLDPSVSPVAADCFGNAYRGGYYGGGNLIFGLDTVKRIGAYLAKYNKNGNIIWAKNEGSFQCQSVACDLDGNVFLAGDSTTHNLSVLQKCDSSGNVTWAEYSQNGNASARFVTTDSKGNSYITGNVSGTVTFGSVTLSPSANSVPYAAKYDKNGNAIWAKSAVVSSTSNDISYCVAADKFGNVYETGDFRQLISFGKDTLNTQNAPGDVYLVKYDSLGNVLWARQSVTPDVSNQGYASSVVVDNEGNAYITGSYRDTISFGSFTLTAPKSNNYTFYSIYFAKYDSKGNVVWAQTQHNGLNWIGFSLSADTMDHIYMDASYGYDTLKFGSYSLYTSNNPTAILQFDTAGNVLCASSVSNARPSDVENEWVTASSDPTGQYIYLGGLMGLGTVFCGPDTVLDVYGPCYTLRWESCSIITGMDDISHNLTRVGIFPNPNNGVFTITSKEIDGRVEIYNMVGEKVNIRASGEVNGEIRIDIGKQPPGMYFYRIISPGSTSIVSGKFIVE